MTAPRKDLFAHLYDPEWNEKREELEQKLLDAAAELLAHTRAVRLGIGDDRAVVEVVASVMIGPPDGPIH